MQLAYKEVYVVAGVPDEGRSLMVARKVVCRTSGVRAEQELVRIFFIVEKRISNGPIPVEAFEVEPWRARF